METNRVHRLRSATLLGLGELPGEHAAGADVAGLAGPDHVVQRLHGLLDRGPGVPPVDLVEVDVLHVQSGQGGVDTGQDVLAGQAAAVLARGHRHVDLGGHDQLLPAEVLGEQSSGGHLAGAARVGVGGVEEGDASFDRGPHDGLGLVLVEDPGPIAVVPEAHHPEAHPGHPQAGPSEIHVLHGYLLDSAAPPLPTRWSVVDPRRPDGAPWRPGGPADAQARARASRRHRSLPRS